LELVIDII